MTWRILRLAGACVVLFAAFAPACGGNSSETHASAGSPGSGGARPIGSGGSGTIVRGGGTSVAGRPGSGGGEPSSQRCGTATCDGITLPVVNLPIPGCCADPKTNKCGLDSSALAMFGSTFAEACQPLAQPGTADASCPLSAKVPVQGTGLEIQFPGCCRPDHTCGYQLDKIGGVFTVGLGCVDATQFLDGGTPQSCGEEVGAAGAGGESSGGGSSGGSPRGVAGTAGVAGSGGSVSSGGDVSGGGSVSSGGTGGSAVSGGGTGG